MRKGWNIGSGKRESVRACRTSRRITDSGEVESMAKLDRQKLDELKKQLTPEQYDICFRGGTEVPYSGKYTDNKVQGIYSCAVCANPLFSSETKYHSGTGWPSFWAPIEGSLEAHADKSFGMVRTEVRCATCGAHLGHVFDDGPEPTGQRYCINSLALIFEKRK